MLADCAAKVLVAHADLLAPIAGAIPTGVEVLAVSTPAEIAASYGCGPGGVLPGATEWDTWLAGHAPWQGAPLPQASSMIYTSGTTGRPKGVRRQPLTADLEARMADYRERVYGLAPGVRTIIPGPLPFRAQCVCTARRPCRQPDRADAALRSRGPSWRWWSSTASRPCSWCRPCSCGCSSCPPSARPLRPLVAEIRDARRRALPAGDQAGDDRVAGAGDPRILRRHRVGRRTVVDSQEWLERPGTVGRPVQGARYASTMTPATARARRGRRGLHAARVPARVHLSPAARQARRDRPRGLHHQRRRRLSRRGRLPVPVRPQARHGDLRRRQHLPGRDRGGADQHARA